MKTVAIFGLGLIGGSFALAMKQSGYAGRILGVSRPQTLDKALEMGAIDAGASEEEAAQVADLLYLAQPISRILQIIPSLNGWVQPQALITDAGSTKSIIVEEARRSITQCQFLGGHPLAGKEVRGIEAASPDLFKGRTYVLTPETQEELRSPAAEEFLTLLRQIETVPIIMTAKEHDRTVTYTSHLPQLASTALATVLGTREASVQRVFGPALLDSTRLALSPFEIWKDILATNREGIDGALSEYITALQRLREELNQGSGEEFFEEGRKFASTVRR